MFFILYLCRIFFSHEFLIYLTLAFELSHLDNSKCLLNIDQKSKTDMNNKISLKNKHKHFKLKKFTSSK